MGAYLSEPITKKISSDERGKNVAFGASSMQGWRVSQEDAHNCCVEYDEETSLFAVYDGHGGHEVATYCSKELPNFIKDTEAYKSGDMKQALIDAFLGFDAALTKPEVAAVLKEIAGTSSNGEEVRRKEKSNRAVGEDRDDEDDDEESVRDLRMEAAMPLEEVMAKYSLCRRDGENCDSLWPIGPSCSSSSRRWVPGEERPAASGSCSSDHHEKTTENCDGDGGSSNGLSVSESSDDTSKSNIGTETKALDKCSSPVTVSLKNGDAVGSCDDTISDAQQTLSQRDKETDRQIRKVLPRITASKCRKPNEDGENDEGGGGGFAVVKDEAEDDDEDDDDDDDQTFDGSPGASDEDTEEAGDEDEQEDSSDDDQDEDDEKDEEEEEEEDDFSMDMTEGPGSDSGCTAVVAILRGRDLYVANAGDSRCVLCRDGQALELSLDHKPEDEPEMERIVKAGGKVTADGRVNGGLNLSRALGDHAYKQNIALPAHEQMISALPDVRHITIEPDRDEFMILACDGIWNFMSSQEVVAFVRPRMQLLPNNEQITISKICEELFDHCLATDTLGDGTGCDNMTAVIVKFSNRHADSGAGSRKRPISPTDVVATPRENSNGQNDQISDKNSEKSEAETSKRLKTEIN